MKNVSKEQMTNMIVMTIRDFKSLIEKITDGCRTVEYGNRVIIVTTEKGYHVKNSTEASYGSKLEFKDTEEILSDYFDVNVLGIHSEMNKSGMVMVYIRYEEKKSKITGLLSYSQMKEMMDKQNLVSGIISVELSEIINSDLESFLDLISERLTGSSLLMGTDYSVVGVSGGDILLNVTGDASMILEE